MLHHGLARTPPDGSTFPLKKALPSQAADQILAEIVAKWLVEHLERAGFVVMKRPAEIGGAAFAQKVNWN
jgi:hypothetical protein